MTNSVFPKSSQYPLSTHSMLIPPQPPMHLSSPIYESNKSFLRLNARNSICFLSYKLYALNSHQIDKLSAKLSIFGSYLYLIRFRFNPPKVKNYLKGKSVFNAVLRKLIHSNPFFHFNLDIKIFP